MKHRTLKSLSILAVALAGIVPPAIAQSLADETLPGPNIHGINQGLHGHVFGEWGGARARLQEEGVDFDLQYIADTLWNINSAQKERLANWSRVRGTVDIDFDKLKRWRGLHFHATALWQGGGILGEYLGLLSSPSGMSSGDTFRLDSWWVEQRLHHERIVVRIGQFAGQDFYGAQHDAVSFIFEPMGYALGNLSTTFETFDPPSTPALEARVIPLRNFYLKSMVFAADRFQYAHNPTGLVPQFRGAAMSASEIGFSPGKKAASIRAFDSVDSRMGYSGLYQFGAAYNPGRFTDPATPKPRAGNYLLYWMANQALWRFHRDDARGLDATAAYDWSPEDVNRNNRLLTAGLRFNEPIPLPSHNTIAFGYVRNSLSPHFLAAGQPGWRAEQGFEVNTLIDVLPFMYLQPVLQRYINDGGGNQHATVFGFRTKIEF
jgi:porin